MITLLIGICFTLFLHKRYGILIRKGILTAMTNMETISFMVLFILCLLAAALKVWDYFMVRRAVNREREAAEAPAGEIVIKSSWRSCASSALLFLAFLAPLLVAGAMGTAAAIVFALLAVAALYYCLYSLLWRITLKEDTFVCRTMTGKQSTYAYADVRRIIPIGRKKRRMDGMRILMADETIIFVDRTLYGLETLERRARAAAGDDFTTEESLSPMKPLR